MIIDKGLELANDQAITVSATLTNVLDRGQAYADISAGEPLAVIVKITETFATLTGLNFQLESDDNASLNTATIHGKRSLVRADGDLDAGKTWMLGVFSPPATERYLGVRALVSGSTATAGKLSAWIVPLSHVQLNPPK